MDVHNYVHATVRVVIFEGLKFRVIYNLEFSWVLIFMDTVFVL